MHHMTITDDGRHIAVDAEQMLYPAICRAAARTPWAILPEKLAQIQELLALRAAGVRFSADEIQARIGAARSRQVAPVNGSVAVIPIYGLLSQRMNLMADISGGTSTEQLSQQLREAMADESIGSIVFDVDSPGGSVSGIPELADEIFGFRGQKPMVAVVNALDASAAYWLTSQTDEVVITPSGQAGSIGVLAIHEDVSQQLAAEGVNVSLIHAGRYKIEGNPYEPLTDEARATIQSDVDTFYDQFVNAVARGRGVRASAVRSGFGEGRVLPAKQAVSAGIADRVDTLRGTIARLSGSRSRARTQAVIEPPAMTASVDEESASVSHELWLLANR